MRGDSLVDNEEVAVWVPSVCPAITVWSGASAGKTIAWRRERGPTEPAGRTGHKIHASTLNCWLGFYSSVSASGVVGLGAFQSRARLNPGSRWGLWVQWREVLAVNRCRQENTTSLLFDFPLWTSRTKQQVHAIAQLLTRGSHCSL